MPKKKPPSELGHRTGTAYKIHGERLNNDQIEEIRQAAGGDELYDKELFLNSFKSHYNKYRIQKTLTITGNSTPEQKREYLTTLAITVSQLTEELGKLDLETLGLLIQKNAFAETSRLSPQPIIDELQQLRDGIEAAKNDLRGQKPKPREDLRLLTTMLHDVIKECITNPTMYNQAYGEFTGDLVDLVTATVPYLYEDASEITNNIIGRTIKEVLSQIRSKDG